MQATIGIYDDHETAVEAVAHLKEEGYDIAKLSIIGLTDVEEVDNDLHTEPKYPVGTTTAAVGTGAAVGAAVGILTGVGIFAIPGLGMLYGAGALVGAIAGFDFGLIGGGLASVLANIGVKNAHTQRYHELLKQGKYIVVAEGSLDDVNNARELMHAHGKHTELDVHTPATA